MLKNGISSTPEELRGDFRVKKVNMNDELNRWIYENLMNVGGDYPRALHPDYCNDLNFAALAEAKVIEKVGDGEYGMILLAKVIGCPVKNVKLFGFNEKALTIASTATALQRCQAMRAAVEGE